MRCVYCDGALLYDREDKCLKCLMCGRLHEAKPAAEQVKKAKPLLQAKRHHGFDQHCDEILADRLAIGHGRTLVKWHIPMKMWVELKAWWVNEGTIVEDLRRSSRRLTSEEAIARVKAEKKHTPTVQEDWPTETKEVDVVKETASSKEPTTPKEKRHYAKSRSPAYWREHREALVTDYYSMPLQRFLETWRVSTSTWQLVRDMLEIPKKSEAHIIYKAPTGKPETVPAFPAFNEQWPSQVQIEWFKSYMDLIEELKQYLEDHDMLP